jgi:hypothetical protein
MEQPDTGSEIDQQNPIREDQELAQQDITKRHVNRIATERKDACGDEFIGMRDIDAHAKTPAKRNETEEHEQQPHATEQHPNPGDYSE